MNRDLFEPLKSDQPLLDCRPLDVTDSDAIKAIAGSIVTVDVLMNCAGYVHHETIVASSRKVFPIDLRMVRAKRP